MQTQKLSLTSREKEVLRLLYGLDGDALDLKQAGEKLGVTPERVRQLYVKAMRKIDKNVNPRIFVEMLLNE